MPKTQTYRREMRVLSALVAMIVMAPLVSASEAVEKPGSPAKDSAAGREPVPAIPLIPKFLNYLSTDSDKQGERGIELLRLLLAGSHWDESEALVAQVVGFRRAIGYYLLSEARARAGDRDQAEAALEIATTLPQGSLDHEKDEIFAARVAALAALGKVDEARETGAKIFTPYLRIEALLDLTEFGDAASAERRAREFQEVEKATFGQKGRAFLFAARTLLASGDKSEAARLAMEGAVTVSKAADDTTAATLCEIAEVLQRCGDAKEAKRWVDVALGFVQHVDNRAHWKAGDLRTVGTAYRNLGFEEDALAVFKLIPNVANSVDLTGMSISGADLAVSFVQRGEMEKFEKTCGVILRTTRQHPHHRARAMGALDVLAAHVRTGLLLSPAIQEELEQTAESIEADPTFQNPV